MKLVLVPAFVLHMAVLVVVVVVEVEVVLLV